MASASPTSVRVAVWGCGHGELDAVYAALERLRARSPDGRAPDVLLCCGDFQSTRNEDDLASMACPAKYRLMRSFFKYYSGAAVAPVLTIFVGGNHEAGNYLRELPYGGWVAPNIYFLGTSGVVRFRGLRLAGISGIFKRYDYRTGFHEVAPFSDDAAHSVMHVREVDVWRLAHLRSPVDIFLSHDWPVGAVNHGDVAALLRAKPVFRGEVESGGLGNPATWPLLLSLKPRFWFSAHLHCKYAAVIPHDGGSGRGGGAAVSGGGSSSAAEWAASAATSGHYVATSTARTADENEIALDDDDEVADGGAGDGLLEAADGDAGGGAGEAEDLVAAAAAPSAAAAAPSAAAATATAIGADGGGVATRFLALDKCLPGRQYLQILDVPVRDAVWAACPAGAACLCREGLSLDAEWCAIVRSSHHLLSAAHRPPTLPAIGATDLAAPTNVAATATMLADAAAAAAGSSVRTGATRCTCMPASCLPFTVTAPPYVPPFPGAEDTAPGGGRPTGPHGGRPMAPRRGNPQTDMILAALGLSHTITVPSLGSPAAAPAVAAAAPAPAAPAAAAAAAAVVGGSGEVRSGGHSLLAMLPPPRQAGAAPAVHAAVGSGFSGGGATSDTATAAAVVPTVPVASVRDEAEIALDDV